MSKIQKAKVSDLINDELNANKGSDFGNELMEKSFSKFGAGRSVLIDKNNKIIAGNKSKSKFADTGGQNVLIVDADRNTLIAVRRNDIDLETPEGREFALADNATNKANLVWDADVIEVLANDTERSQPEKHSLIRILSMIQMFPTPSLDKKKTFHSRRNEDFHSVKQD